MKQPALRKVVIFGVGLIGGSFALGLRKADAVREVVGFGRNLSTLEQAKQLGLIDRIGSRVPDRKEAALLVVIGIETVR